MRKVILSAALVAVALGAPASWAQFEAQMKSAKKVGKTSQPAEGGDDGAEGGDGSDEGGGDGASPIEGQVELRAPEGGAESAPGQVHTVERGDTLWDLSQRYLGSPWYWPKVWSYNPEIANPHWIYPGNRVKFFAGGEEAPTQVEVGQGPDEIEPSEMIPDETDKVQVSGRLAYVPKSAITLTLPGFVTEKEIQETGKIVGSFAQQDMLSYPEQVYVRLNQKAAAPRVGDKYVVFKLAGEVRHPTTGDRLGYLTHIIGRLQVMKTHGTGKNDDDKGPMVTALITNSSDDIHRGDLIGPYAESLTRTVAPRANDRELKATVVGKAVPYLTIAAEHHLIIVDRGSNDGVQPGNTFTVVRQQDGLPLDTVIHPSVRMEEFPKEDVGTCMAFDVKSTATLCIVTRSIREIVTGDMLEMRSASAAAPSAPRAER